MISDLQKLIEIGKKYLEARFELFKLDVEEHVSHYAARAGIFLGALVIILIVTILLAIGFALLLNDLLQSRYWGFFIIAGFFIVISVLLFSLRKKKTVHNFFEGFLKFFLFD